MTIRANECFCGCGRRPESSAELAANLLGWEMNEQLNPFIKQSILLDLMAPERDRANEENFLRDGKTYWVALQFEAHGEAPGDKFNRKAAKHWIKFAKKMFRKTGSGGLVEAMDFPDSSAEEIAAWLLLEENPAWVADVEAEYRSVTGQSD